MLETGVVLSLAGCPIYWHLPAGRTAGSMPDSHRLWDEIWKNRSIVSGFAHSHPGRGMPGPSYTDVTTFAAVEDALGRRLAWPIISSTTLVRCEWLGPGRLDYGRTFDPHWPAWAKTLRRLTYHLHKEKIRERKHPAV